METLKRSLSEAAQKLQKGDVKGAIAALEPLLKPEIEPITRLEALRIVALARLLAGDKKGAKAAMDEAVEVARPLPPSHRGRALERRALIKQDQGELSSARADLEAAAAAFGESGETAQRAMVEDRAGTFAAAAGDFQGAVASHLTAAALAGGALPAAGDRGRLPPSAPGQASKDPGGEALYLVHAGAAAHLGGDMALARTALERAVSLLVAESPLRSEALHNLGIVLSDMGEHGRAVETLEAGLASDLARNAPKDAIATRLRLALALRRKGDVARARDEAKRARADAEAAKDLTLLVDSLLELSSAELAARSGEAALQAAKAAVDASQETPRLLARTTLHSASCAKALGKKETARAGFKMAKEIAEASGEPALAAAAERELSSLG
jgi:tetratricopeptide (TPR) repeat protein